MAAAHHPRCPDRVAKEGPSIREEQGGARDRLSDRRGRPAGRGGVTVMLAPDLSVPGSYVPGTNSLELDREIETLSTIDLHQLRVRWRKHLRGLPPPHLSRGLLFRLLAYRIQAKAYGELDRET